MTDKNWIEPWFQGEPRRPAPQICAIAGVLHATSILVLVVYLPRFGGIFCGPLQKTLQAKHARCRNGSREANHYSCISLFPCGHWTAKTMLAVLCRSRIVVGTKVHRFRVQRVMLSVGPFRDLHSIQTFRPPLGFRWSSQHCSLWSFSSPPRGIGRCSMVFKD